MIGHGGAIKANRAQGASRGVSMETMMRAAPTFAMIAALVGSLASIAPAQSKPDSESFVEAIEEQRNNDVISLVNKHGRGIINRRSYAGVTPLTVAMRKRASLYVNYLLQNGADPNLAEKNGDTALMIAARSGYAEGINSMIVARAAVDGTNRMGETALIIAVQNHQVAAVRRLLEAGASASKADSASGLSARDYAARDRRSNEILKLIDSVKPKPQFVAGPIIR
jgi:uncharacterized protein